jgi:hypothetical protein
MIGKEERNDQGMAKLLNICPKSSKTLFFANYG